MEEQNLLVNRLLRTIKFCDVKELPSEENIVSVKDVDVNELRNLLTKRYNNGFDMKAVYCLIQDLIKLAKQGKRNGIYNLTEQIKTWLLSMKKLGKGGIQGMVFMSTVLDDGIEVIIKVPKKVRDYNNILREYFLAIAGINDMRQYVPNFMYTLGSFLCPMPESTLEYEKLCNELGEIPFLMIEKIRGDTLKDAFMKNKITFDDFLAIFIQVLLALEVAQDKIEFTHYDLHFENVVLRPITSEYKYKVPLATKAYNITATKYIPMMIDFGLSSIRYKENTFGTYEFTNYGIQTYMIQGFDMYKLLIFSAAAAERANNMSLQNKITELFKFYKNDDPYNMTKTPTVGLSKALSSDNLCKEVAYSNAAYYTPRKFIEWIKKHYSTKTSFLTIVERDLVINLPTLSTTYEYNVLTNQDISTKSVVEKCMKPQIGYTLNLYNIHILKSFSKEVVVDYVKEYENLVEKNGEQLVKNDVMMFEKYKEIKVENEDVLRKSIKAILSHNLTDINNKRVRIDKTKILKQVLDDRTKLNTSLSFYYKLLPYLQFFYTYQQLEIKNDLLNVMIKEFLKSSIYVFYKKYELDIEQSVRWSKTLQSYVNSLYL